MEHLVGEAATGQRSIFDVVSRLTALASEGWIDQRAEHSAAERGLESAVNALLDKGLISAGQEARLASFATKLGFTQSELNESPTFQRLVKCAVLRDISEGKLPKRYSLQGGTLFNLQKGEVLIWVFPGVRYYEDKTHRSYVGGSQGVSVRLAKGFYYHTSAFRGQQIEMHGIELIESGQKRVPGRTCKEPPNPIYQNN